MNRKLDFILYVNPLLRFAYVIGLVAPIFLLHMLAPFIVPLSFVRTGLFQDNQFAVALTLYGGAGAIVGYFFMSKIFDMRKQPRRFFLAAVWWPVALVTFLASWILFGHVAKGPP